MKIINSVTEVRDRCDCRANKDDLCLTLKRNLNSLYLLAFLLAASHVEAERCIESLIDKAFKQRGISRSDLASSLKFSLIEIAVNRCLRKPRQLTITHEHLFQFDTSHNVHTNAND